MEGRGSLRVGLDNGRPLPTVRYMGAPAGRPRDLILQSATDIFARKGYAGTSVQEILQAVRLSKPTLYYYFKSKAGLFRAILDSAYDESFYRITEAVHGKTGCADRLVAVADALFSFARQHHRLMRLVFATIFAAPEEIPPDSINPAKRVRNFQLVLEIVRHAQKSGEIDPGYPAAELTHLIVGAISHHIRTYLLSPDEGLNRRRAARIVSLFLDGARKRRPCA